MYHSRGGRGVVVGLPSGCVNLEQGWNAMPLLAYFGTVGALLAGLLLLTNLLLVPPRSEGPRLAVSVAESDLPKPRSANRVERYTVGVTRIAPSEEMRGGRLSPAAPARSEPTGSTTPDVVQSESKKQPREGERSSPARAKPKSKVAKVRTMGRNARVAGRQYDGTATYPGAGSFPVQQPMAYTQERRRWSFSAEGSLGPH